MCNIVPVPNKNHCSLHCLKTTLVPVQWNNELKQQGDGAGETSTNDKLRVAWHGLGNTRARRTNTAKRAPNMLMYHNNVHVCAISILFNFHTNPYQSSETTS